MMDTIDVIEMAILVGMTASSFTQILRSLSPINKWAMEGRKPWGCDLCMSLWASLLSSVLFFGLSENTGWFLSSIPGISVALWITRRMSPALPEIPPLEDLDS